MNVSTFQIMVFATAWILPALVILSLTRWIGNWRVSSRPSSMAAGLLVVLSASFQLWIQWPGLTSVDNLHLLVHLLYREASTFHSYTYSLLSDQLDRIWNFPLGHSLVNLWLLAVVAFTHGRLFPFRARQWQSWAFLILFLLPQTQILVLFQNRDSLFSLLVILLVLKIWEKSGQPPQDQIRGLWKIFLLAGLVAELRQDGLILLGLMTIALLWLHRKNRQSLRQVALSLTASLAIFFGFPWSLGYRPFSDDVYQSTSLLHPLSHVLHSKGLSAFDAGDLEKIDRFFSLEHLVKYYSLVDIDPFHQGGLRAGATKRMSEDFQEVAQRLIRQEPGLYLESRWRFFQRITNLDLEGSFFHDAVSVDFPANPTIFKDISVHIGPRPFSGLRWQWYRWMNFYFKELPLPWALVFSTAVLPLTFLAALMILNSSRSMIFWLAGMLFIRSLAVFALTPSALFKYITSSWFLGWWLFLVWTLIRAKPANGPPDSSEPDFKEAASVSA